MLGLLNYGMLCWILKWNFGLLKYGMLCWILKCNFFVPNSITLRTYIQGWLDICRLFVSFLCKSKWRYHKIIHMYKQTEIKVMRVWGIRKLILHCNTLLTMGWQSHLPFRAKVFLWRVIFKRLLLGGAERNRLSMDCLVGRNRQRFGLNQTELQNHGLTA